MSAAVTSVAAGGAVSSAIPFAVNKESELPTSAKEEFQEITQLTSERPQLSSKSKDEDILKEVCLNNGVTYTKLSTEGPSVEVLEMFFSGFPRLTGMHHFPNIHTLTIIGQSISCISGLSTLSELTELWVAECQIEKIQGLEECTQLQKLYLYGNKIKTIENLEKLVLLKVLWLNGNVIRNIENLSNLAELQELNLAENQIEKIGHALDSNINIEDLNLSGNQIFTLQEVTNLVRLPKLKSASFKDPLYQPCPVSTLCNYSTHVLFHLPTLCHLDTCDVSSRQLSDLAQSTVLKKKMYYNMRFKTVQRNMANLIQKLEMYKKQQVLLLPYQCLRMLTYTIKEMERELEERGETLSEGDDLHDNEKECDWKSLLVLRKADRVSTKSVFQTKLNLLNKRRAHWEQKCAEVEEMFNEAEERIQKKADAVVNRLDLELETGGNVRFEEGTSKDQWFTSCRDLIMSRFCAKDFLPVGVVGVTIHRIIRIHNRILRSVFDKKLICHTEATSGEYNPTAVNTLYKMQLEYLFWMWDPATPGGANEQARVLEEGFMDAESCKMLERPAAVPLSNSLFLADRHRIAYLSKQRQQSKSFDPCLFRFSQLIVAKAYLGKSEVVNVRNWIAKECHPNADSVYKSWASCFPFRNEGSCECRARQCEWYIFDHELVLPEYIVELEYLTEEPVMSPFILVPDDLLGNNVVEIPSMHLNLEKTDDDEDILNMEPVVQQRCRNVALTEEMLLKTAGMQTLRDITNLNLHGNGLAKLKEIQTLVSLKRLIVSFNELTSLADISEMEIEYLDASYNKIITLEGMKSMNRLLHLDLSWNKLQNTTEELSLLQKHVAHVSHLDLRHNPWLKPKELRLRVIGNLKTLKWLDGRTVTETEVSMARRMSAASCLSQLLVLAHSRTDILLPRSLSLGSGAHLVMQASRLKPEKFSETDTSWHLNVTTLKVEGQFLTKLCNLEGLQNLRWASFDNNNLTRIEGLDNCTQLEDLSLDNNCIMEMTGLQKLSCLRRLSLAHNFLTSVDASIIACLPQLAYLALDTNQLTSLAGLVPGQALVELYLGNNLITNIHEIFCLKNLASLVILDLYGNPVATEMCNYRLFVIFHLKMLKALDGDAIESQEGIMAKETFGGRLTLDLVAEKLGHTSFLDVRELDIRNNGIRTVDLGSVSQFMNLRSLNLENNSLTSFSGLTSLVNLRVLCLNNNHIESIVPRTKGSPVKQKCPSICNAKTVIDFTVETLAPLLENLEVLHLGYNGIKDMAALQLGHLPLLKALFLQGNEITKVEGLETLHDLRELVLDRNKIKTVSQFAFSGQWNLQELHLEENRIRELGALCCLENLQRLYLGSNRIQDMTEIEKLDVLANLREISVVNNVIARRSVHRIMLVYRMPQLLVIDGIPVNEEERYRATLFFGDQSLGSGAGEFSLPVVPSYPSYKAFVPVKVATVQLSSLPLWAGYASDDNEVLQRGAGRRRGLSKPEVPRSGAFQNLNIPMAHHSSLQMIPNNRSGGGNGTYHFFGQNNPNQTSDYIQQITRLQQKQRSNKR